MKLGMFHLVLTLAVALPLTGVRANAADNAKKDAADQSQAVELFQAIDEGLVEVKLTPKSSLKSSIAVTNKTNKPIVVEMPSAFAGVPVLAQPGGFGGGGFGAMGGMRGGPGGGFGGGMFGEGMDGGRNGRGGGMGGGRGGTGGGNQSIGGGMGGRGGMGGMGGMMGGRGGRGGGGMFAIEPNKTRKENVRTVCLEHGKKEPRPNVEYTIVPIDQYTDNKTTQVLCAMLGDEEVNQNALQAAVWNTENGLTFDELAAKTKQEGGNNQVMSYFNADELSVGSQLIEKAQKRAEVLQEVEDAQEDLRNYPAEKTDDTVDALTNEVLK